MFKHLKEVYFVTQAGIVGCYGNKEEEGAAV